MAAPVQLRQRPRARTVAFANILPMDAYAPPTASALPQSLKVSAVDEGPVAHAYVSTGDDFDTSTLASATVLGPASAPPSQKLGASTVIVFTEVLPMGSYAPPPPAAGTISPEVLSVTIPATYPQCGNEMMITSPSTGEQVKFFVPAGSQPGSQVLLVLHRA